VNEQSQKHLDRILNEGIKPQGETLAPIIAKGDVAVIVFEPSPETVGALKMLGWDGETGAFRLSNSKRKQIAASSEQRGDWVTAKWLRSSKRGRIFVFAQRGTLLVNLTDEGYSLEPGSVGGGSLN
jgi:hypothetical protein